MLVDKNTTRYLQEWGFDVWLISAGLELIVFQTAHCATCVTTLHNVTPYANIRNQTNLAVYENSHYNILRFVVLELFRVVFTPISVRLFVSAVGCLRL